MLGFLLIAAIKTSAHATATDVSSRIQSRSFPSVFQAWIDASIPGDTKLMGEARHDLLWLTPDGMELRWAGPYPGTSTSFTPASLAVARTRRATIAKMNPNAVILCEIRYRDAPKGYLPDDSTIWKRDDGGRALPGWVEGGHTLLDFAKPELRQIVVDQCRAIMESGVFDGVMLDSWNDEGPDRLTLLSDVRKAVGDDALIIVNTTDRIPVKSASYINGIFMEGFMGTWSDWHKAASNMQWMEENARSPQITALEGWFDLKTGSRLDLKRMRFVTTLSLLYSNGYVLFGDPNPLPTLDHAHNWYAFWNKSLGRALDQSATVRPDGAVQREYEKGTVIMNPPENQSLTVKFDDSRKSAASGVESRSFILAPGDGDLFVGVNAKR